MALISARVNPVLSISPADTGRAVYFSLRLRVIHQGLIVKQLFKENELLMDLSAQPEHIQAAMVRIVLKGLANPGAFSYFHFMKFLGKYEMMKLAQNADNFVNLLSR